jgi:hypothetical protein
MDYSEHYEAAKAAFIDAMAETTPRSQMMPVEAFDAEDDGGDPVRVIGVIEDGEVLKFLVIEESEDGEIYPIARTTIYRKGTAARPV